LVTPQPNAAKSHEGAEGSGQTEIFLVLKDKWSTEVCAAEAGGTPEPE